MVSKMAHNEPIWDCIVIGGGIIGLWTAYHLTKSGATVLVLEQFHLPHTRGSSHGQSRLIRKWHENGKDSDMTQKAYDMWQKLEKESGKELIVQTEFLLLQKREAKKVQQAAETMKNLSMDYEMMSNFDLKKKYPMIRYPNDYKGVLDKTAGLLVADSCVRALCNLVESSGGTIKDGTQVTDIQPNSTVTIHTNKGKFYAKKTVVTTGPWVKEMLLKLGVNIPLKTMPGCHVYWKSYKDDEHDIGKIPEIYDEITTPNGYRFYLVFPSYEYPGLVKVVTRGEPAPFYCHPDERDSHSMDEMIDLLSKYIKEHFPGLETKPSIIEPCMYCVTPDKIPIIDKHPRHNNIIIGAGFSTKGFSLAPISGEILADLHMERPVKWDLTKFSIDRFKSLSNL